MLFDVSEQGSDAEPVDLAAADLSGDTVLDLVTANAGTGEVSVLLGRRDGSFGSPTMFAAAGCTSLAVADFNGDQAPDLATTNGNGLGILSGDGQGNFDQLISIGLSGVPVSVAAGFIDEDQCHDLVTANSRARDLAVLVGNCQGGFETESGPGVGGSPAALALADFNKDGCADVVTANTGSNDVSALLGELGDLGDCTGELGVVGRFDVGGAPVAIAEADLDGDTCVDVVTANGSSNEVSVLLGDCNGGFPAPERFGVTGGTVSAVAAADLNGDGHLDLVTANSGTDDVSVLLGNGAGGFAEQRPAFAVGGEYPIAVVVADLNMDNLPDVVTANRDSDDVSVLLGRLP